MPMLLLLLLPPPPPPPARWLCGVVITFQQGTAQLQES
jgi:hypothetical protein